MSNLSKESIRKLRRLQKAILAEPEFYAQTNFPEIQDCGAVCCIAGWAVWLDNPKGYAKKVIDVGVGEWPKRSLAGAGRLQREVFHRYGTFRDWIQRGRKPFRDALFDARTKRSKKPKIAAALIDSFIEKDGVL